MNVIELTPLDLSRAALSWRMRLGVEQQLLIAALRTTLQLLLIGLVFRLQTSG